MEIKSTIWSYLEPLLYSKESLHLADISKKLNKPHTSVRKYLNFFEKQGVLIKDLKGRLTLYKFNYSFPLLVDYFVIVEKEKLIKKCKKDLLMNEVVYFLHKNLKEHNKALIFGSAVENANKANDIDLLITGKTNFEKNLEQFKKKFNVKIHLINVKKLKEVTEALKIEIIKKHIIVHGSEEIVKWLI